MAIFGTILVAACLFFFYALVKFHLEATRPRTRHKNRVIVFRNVVAKSSDEKNAQQANPSGNPGNIQGLVQPLPFGVRRLAVKAASRR
jgi:hypothetical protein